MNIHILPALSDNYIYLIENGDTAIAIDPSEAKPVLEFLLNHNLKLTHILNTHHHRDHIGGNIELKKACGCKIIAAQYDQERINNIDQPIKDKDIIKINNLEIRIIYIPGHTTGHIAYYFPKEEVLFCGDTLFSLGCGRLFEGTPGQMFQSLKKLTSLPLSTQIFCGHEYTEQNAEFALTLEPNNLELVSYYQRIKKLRKQNLPTLPSNLELELKANPFLRTESPEIRKNLNMINNTDLEVFTKIRKLKDSF